MLRRIRRWTLPPLAAAALLLTGTGNAQAISTPQTGTHDGWFYSLTREQGSVDLQLQPGGGYRVSWGQGAVFMAGKGWRPGGPRTLTYSADFRPQGNAYLAVYGWTRAPLTEYYIIENWGSYRPTGTPMGTVFTDGGVYDLYRIRRTPPPAILGSPWMLYLSVRQARRSAGQITMANHFDAWTRAGAVFGTHDYTLLATEGYLSPGGGAAVTICSAPDPSPPAPAGPVRLARATSKPAAAPMPGSRTASATRRTPAWGT